VNRTSSGERHGSFVLVVVYPNLELGDGLNLVRYLDMLNHAMYELEMHAVVFGVACDQPHVT
jgi:hypothetical protein